MTAEKHLSIINYCKQYYAPISKEETTEKIARFLNDCGLSPTIHTNHTKDESAHSEDDRVEKEDMTSTDISRDKELAQKVSLLGPWNILGL